MTTVIHCPFLAAHTAFFPGDTVSSSGCTVEVEGKLRKVLFEAKMVGSKGSTEFKKEEGWINGMASMEVELTTGLVNLEEKGGKLKLDLAHLLPGASSRHHGVKPSGAGQGWCGQQQQ